MRQMRRQSKRKDPAMMLCVQAYAVAGFGRAMSPDARGRLRRAHAAVADMDLGHSLNRVRDTAKEVIESGGDPDACRRLKELASAELTKGRAPSYDTDRQGGFDLGGGRC